MSRPKAWNGTAWVDPSFWTGSAWKTYIPATYDVPQRYLFNSNNEGWTYNQPDVASGPAGWTSGYIYGRTPGGLLSSVYLSPPTAPAIVVPPSTTSLRYKYSWQTVKIGASATDITVRFDAPTAYGGTNANDVVDYPSQAQSGTYTTKSLAVTPGQSITPRPAISVNDAYMGSGNQTEIRLLQVELINQNGNLVYTIGDPGWEPKVKRADGTWK